MKLATTCRIFALTLGFVLAAAVGAQAKQALTGDVSLDVAGEPDSGFGNAFGPTFGLGMDIGNDLQARGDLSYFHWSHTVTGLDLSYTRIPIVGSLRKYFSVPADKKLKPFVQGGMGISFDSVDAAVGAPAARSSKSDVHFGLVLGGGAEYALNDRLGAQAMLKYNIETDAYYTFGLGLAYHF